VSQKSPSPQATVAILLGASEWPNYPDFEQSPAFANSANRLKTYLLNPQQFGLPSENLLDLFDADQGVDDIDRAIGDWLNQRIANMEARGNPVRDLLVYYVGHGGFSGFGGLESQFFLAIRRTRSSNPQVSGIGIASLSYTLKQKARRIRRLIILDCCFAATAFHAFQSTPGEVAGQQAFAALAERSKGTGYPERGSALLCSSGPKVPSLISRDGNVTLFTEALLYALFTGDTRQPQKLYLSLRELTTLITEFLEDSPEENAPKPYIGSPDQSEGDVADIPFFPNPHAKQGQERQVEEARQHQAEASKQSTTIPLPSDPAGLSTLTSRQAAVSSSFAAPTLPGEAIEDASRASEHSPASLSAREWYRRGIEALAQEEFETAVEAWQHILKLDPGYDGGKLAEEVDALTPQRIARREKQAMEAGQAKNWDEASEAWSALLRLDSGNQAARNGLRESLRAGGSAAYERGKWEEAIEKWEAFLQEVPNEKLIHERLDAARVCQQYRHLYENVRLFIAENKFKVAEKQLETLYKRAPYYGDPQGLAQQIGYPVPPDFPTVYQQREKQQEELVQRQLQRRQQIKDGGLSGMQWGALIGAVVGIIVGSGLDGANFASREWWMGVGVAALGGLLIGALGGAIGVGIGYLVCLVIDHEIAMRRGLQFFWTGQHDLSTPHLIFGKNLGWRTRIFGGTLTGALLGAIIGTVDTIFIVNIVFNNNSDLFNNILGAFAIIGIIIGGGLGWVEGKEEGGWYPILTLLFGAVVGFFVGSLVGGGIGWVIAGGVTILSQGWSIAMLPGAIAGGLIGLLYSSLVSLIMQRSSSYKINYTSFGATGAIISTMGGSVLGCVIGLSHQSGHSAFVGAVIGLVAGSLGVSILGGIVGLIGTKIQMTGKGQPDSNGG
jgi:tetratricopeptide (TPR) repeat protein